MKTKKILSLVMAIAMALSLAVTALADTPTLDDAPTAGDTTDLEHAAQYTGATTVPTIDLAVNGTNSILAFNPYKLAIKVDATGEPKSDGTATANDQLITKEITITNKTNVPLKMEGSLKVTPYLDTGAPSTAQAATLTNKAIAATETAKKLYVYADFYAFDAAYATVPDRTKTAAATQRLVAATAGTAVTHAAASRVLMQATDGTTPNYVYVKVSGEATTVPTEAWGAYDKVQIDLVFTFQSQPNPDKFAIVEKNDSADVAAVKPTFSDADAKVAKGNDATDLCKGVVAKGVPGSVYFIYPASGKKITAVKFYEKTGTTAITTVKAATTDSKTPTAPWSFTMPTDGVVMEVTTAAAT